MSYRTGLRSLALIGAGYWGKNLARNFNELGVLHTICDRSEECLSIYASKYPGVATTTNVNSVLGNKSIHQVAIATSAVFHYELAKAALLSQKDVFVEKPLCLDWRQGQELVDLARHQHRVLMVGHLLQYHPCIERLRAILAAGELGRLYYITSNRLNLGKIRREENALWSFAPHDISVILSLAGDQLPEQIVAVGESYLTSGVADTTVTAMRFSGGVRAHIHVSWLSPFKEQKLTVIGSDGMAVFDDTQPWPEKLVLYRHYLKWENSRVPTATALEAEPVVVEQSEPLRNECSHFLECCRSRSVPRTDGVEGLRVLQVLQSAQQSLDKGGSSVACEELSRLRSGCELFVHPTAILEPGVKIGKGTKVWHFGHIMEGAEIGERCIFGQNVNVAGGAVIGDNVKVQNNVSIYNGVVIEDDVFLGPSCVFTNVRNPRSEVNRHAAYEKTTVKRGATIGANATIVCGVTVGRYAFIGAGCVVTKDVPDYALMMGNPGRQNGWISRHGHTLENPDKQNIMVCPESGYRYQLERLSVGACRLRCLDLDENADLPSAPTQKEGIAAAASPPDMRRGGGSIRA